MEPTPPKPRLVVGLGNVGERYRLTRHNIGFMVVDRLAARRGVALREERRWRSALARHGGVFYIKPSTLMNLSGEAVGPLARFYEIAPEETLVVLDEVALPFGQLRLRPGGSAGGHRGLRSVIEHLATTSVPRLRVGIGGADQRDRPERDLADYVLSRPTGPDADRLDEVIDRAADAVECIAREGWERAMNVYNQKEQTP